MDHAESLKTRATTLYLLNQLRDDQREAFEEHFFDCPLCAGEVRAGMLLMDNAAALLMDEPVAKPVKQRPAWLAALWPQPAFLVPACALVVVAGFLVHDHTRVGDLERELASATAPQAVADAPFDAARGNEAVTVTREQRYLVASFNLSTESVEPSYLIEITGEGVAPVTVRSAPPAIGSPFRILLPSARYKAGRYEFTIKSGNTGAEIQRIPLTLK